MLVEAFAELIDATSQACRQVENKLWAGQRGGQLDVYFDAYSPVDAEFVYLTPDGVKARSTRPEVVAAFRPVSWRRAVMPDLRDAIVAAELEGNSPRLPRSVDTSVFSPIGDVKAEIGAVLVRAGGFNC